MKKKNTHTPTKKSVKIFYNTTLAATWQMKKNGQENYNGPQTLLKGVSAHFVVFVLWLILKDNKILHTLS
jgi:hypothetical protein